MDVVTLTHPIISSVPLTAIKHWELFDARIYVVAEFSDGNIFHFYDGAHIDDWIQGKIFSGENTYDRMVALLATAIDEDSRFSATAAGAVLTITNATEGAEFEYDTLATNVDGGTDDQTIAAVQTVDPANPVDGAKAFSKISVLAGTDTATAASGTVEVTGGSGDMTSLTFMGADLLSGDAVTYDTDDDTTAEALKEAINAKTATQWPFVTATRAGPIVTITAPKGLGASANTEDFTIAGTITGTTAAMSGGADGNTITKIFVDGFSVLDYTISWYVDNSTTGTLLAATINNSPVRNSEGFVATSVNGTITITAPTTGVEFNEQTLGSTTPGTVLLTAAPSDFSGGVDTVAGATQVVEFTFGGTVEAGDAFTVALEGTDYGARSNPLTLSDKPITFRSKIYTGRDTVVHYSGIDSPDVFNEDHPTKIGAGFLSINNHSANASKFRSVGVYQDLLAIFTEGAVQLWSVSADDTQNALIQVVDKVGCIAAESVQSYGAIDLFFLDRTGVRSLRARDSSNLASMSDVGSAIDTIIQDHIRSMTEAELAACRSIIDP